MADTPPRPGPCLPGAASETAVRASLEGRQSLEQSEPHQRRSLRLGACGLIRPLSGVKNMTWGHGAATNHPPPPECCWPGSGQNRPRGQFKVGIIWPKQPGGNDSPSVLSIKKGARQAKQAEGPRGEGRGQANRPTTRSGPNHGGQDVDSLTFNSPFAWPFRGLR